jgi:hypothetical protein
MKKQGAWGAIVGVTFGSAVWLLVVAYPANAVPRSCAYDGRNYYHGSVSCQGGSAYQCDDGSWRSLGRSC